MKIKLKTFKQLVKEYGIDDVVLDDTRIKECKINNWLLTSKLKYLGKTLEVKYETISGSYSDYNGYIWKDWMVEEVIEKQKLKVVENFKNFCYLIGTGRLFHLVDDNKKAQTELTINSSLAIVKTSWECISYYEKLE